ncbi:TonB-dependent receptor plug domain-containing protein [Hufsiella ginkgonis]|uniref:TonB-dependent receptor n=1 Tax=Hufsiella ginkgonis TaxID=2695274 RepID=A0A7K1XZL6_9SPHI|nr:TonB-dependent receptor [Hufsiella ginkgonis]MXV16257.1 TonB-dependent receptor [Hufsiella ginkgonis]
MKKEKIVIAASLGFAQLALLSTAAHAQERPARELDEVVVTATRSPKKQSEIGKVVKVIDAKQIAASQGRTLVDVLNNVAGLQLSGGHNAPGSNITLFTLGAASGNTLVLIDGIPANNAGGITGEYDISSIAIDQVERIEILKGGNSTLYGSDAVAGVVNIITKQPSKDVHTDLLLTGGTYGTFKQALGVSGTSGKTAVSLNVSNNNSDGFSSAKGDESTFDKDGFNQKALTTHVRQQLTDKLSLQGNVQFNWNKFDLDAGAFADDKDYTAKNSSFFGGLNAAYALPKGTINLIFNQNNVRNQFTNPGTGTSFSRQDNKGRVTYSEAILSQQFIPALGLTAGVNYRRSETDQTYESRSSFGPFNSYLKADDANNNIFSGYASFFLKAAGFNTELGGRYNHHSQYGNNYTYTVNPSYVIADRYKVFVSASSAFKAPSLYHLTSEYKNPNGLEPETTTSYEAGTELELVESKLKLNVAGFIRDTKNLIYFYTDPVTFASAYRNGSKQHDKGLEAEVAVTPTDRFKLEGWFAYVKGEGTDAAGAKTNYLLRRPEKTFGANAGYEFSKLFSAKLIYKYTGSRLDPFGYPVVNTNQHAFTLLDTYLQLKPTAALVVFADIKNIFDEGYTEWQGYTTAGRNFNAGVKYTIK